MSQRMISGLWSQQKTGSVSTETPPPLHLSLLLILVSILRGFFFSFQPSSYKRWFVSVNLGLDQASELKLSLHFFLVCHLQCHQS